MRRNTLKNLFFIAILLIYKCTYAQMPTEEDKALRASVIELSSQGKHKEAFAVLQTIKHSAVRNATTTEYIRGLFVSGKTEEALHFAEDRMDSLKGVTQDPTMRYAFENFTNPYANLLVEFGKYEKASAIFDAALAADKDKSFRYNVLEVYIKALMGSGRASDAMKYIKQSIAGGNTTPFVRDTALRKIYVQLHGNDEGLPKLQDSLRNEFRSTLKADLIKKATKQVAPRFELKDAEGTTVSLASLYGKTVVLDFWANWCGPCKEAFPLMKSAQDHYKSNPNVVFLFLHTLEQGNSDPVPVAVEYMEKNGYDFKVLFDRRQGENRESKVAKAYGVSAIPTKCIIDPKGNLVFTSVGGVNYNQTNAYAFDYLLAMIDLASSGTLSQ